jgi:hypothetical protein
MTQHLLPDVTGSKSWRVQGEPPWFPNLAEVIDPAPALLDRLVTEFAPIGASLATQTAWWMAFHMWAVDRLAGEAMAGTSKDRLREAVWVLYASSYWSTLELQLIYGMPPAVINLGMTAASPSEDSVADFASKFSGRQAALDTGGRTLIDILPTLLREEPCTGALHGTAYNTGYVEVICEVPPLGELPGHLHVETGAIRVNPRDFMRIDYDMPAPGWLKTWRATYENSVRAHPDTLERVVSGEGKLKDLRDIWGEGLAWGHNNWGGQSLDKWTQPYFEDVLHWSVVYNFGLEAISLASLTALVEGDEGAAARAITGNALYLGSWGAAVMGLIDPNGKLPDVVPA